MHCFSIINQEYLWETVGNCAVLKQSFWGLTRIDESVPSKKVGKKSQIVKFRLTSFFKVGQIQYQGLWYTSLLKNPFFKIQLKQYQKLDPYISFFSSNIISA